MFPARDRTQAAVERFFQFSLLSLVGSGFLALIGTGLPDRATIVVAFLGLALRAAMITGTIRLRISQRDVSSVALIYVVFFPLDFYLISHDFLHATMHGVCFLAVVKILTARTNGDYIYTGAIGFMALVAAALLAANSNFFLYLAVFVVCAIAVFTSAEIRNSLATGIRTAAPERAGMAWRLIGLAAAATAGLLVLTAGLFLSIPRTARMAATFFPGSPRLTGFSGEIDLGGFGGIARDDRPVLNVYSERPLPDGLYWRGAALSYFDGRRWYEGPGRNAVIPAPNSIAVVADKMQLSRRDGYRMLYRVEVQNSATGRLFIAGIPEFINVDAPFLIEGRGQSFTVTGPLRQNLAYQVSAHAGPPIYTALTPEDRRRNLRFPAVDLRILELARDWAGRGTDLQRAVRIGRHLQNEYKYKLDGPPAPARDPLADFLFVRREGYCEYFASAMVVMLRSIGIPARVATGFYGGYHNDVSGLYVVRASDAHAWVEAWLDDVGWRAFDPTPPASDTANAGLFPRLRVYLDAIDHAWREWVVAYDLRRQAAVAAKVQTILKSLREPHLRSLSFLRIWAALIAAVAAAAYLALRIRRKRRSLRGLSEAGLLYARMLDKLARKGFHKPASATPAEFASQLPDAERMRVREFTELYHAARFGGDIAAKSRMAAFLKAI